MKIGNIEIKNRVVLAPMAGVSNPSYMKICEEMGVSYVVTELISAEAIVRNNKKTFAMLNGLEDLKIPVAVQLFGSNAKTLSEAAKIVTNLYKNVFIDINMGCPVPKVALKSGSGSALLKDLDKIYEIVSSVVKSVSCPVTVKIRSGWDNNSINAKEVAKVIEKAGASAITIHGRTRSQGYSGVVSLDIIKQVTEVVSIPVIGNGDIKSGFDALNMIDKTGCNLVMVGRKAMGNPWIFKEINAYLKDKTIIEKPTDLEKIDMCLKHFNYLLHYTNEKQAVLEIRNHVSWYLKGIEGSNEIKNTIFKTTDASLVKELLQEFKNNLKKD